MNFFQSQDIARNNTRKLIILFALAVISLILLTNLFLVATFAYFKGSVLTMQTFSERFDIYTFIYIGVAVTSVVLIASLYKLISLSGGGSKVMSYMDAQIIIHNSGDLDKQKILNVVEEMAIASGTPVPQVYLLKEAGINAFAAGLTTHDAAIAVTRGAIEHLSREQLQGVIAHEFSHILNGDMRLNLRLIGILYGIMVIGLIGEFFLRSGRHGSSSKNYGALIGLGLVVIGYAGTFFGKWIKAAVSRQREYLADASAVQFTRNPDGIAGALKKIGGYDNGSQIENPRGSEISHALFSEGVKSYFNSLFATHPPLSNRIKRILPRWDGKFTYSDISTDLKAGESSETNNKYVPVSGFASSSMLVNEEIIDTVGHPTQQHIQQALTLIDALPSELYQSAHEPHGARAVIYFLLLDNEQDIRQKQLKYCRTNADDGVYSELVKFVNKIKSIDIKHRLSIIDITLPALRQLSQNQEKIFLKNFVALVKMDSKISLFEWSMQKIIFINMNDNYNPQKLKAKSYPSIHKLKNECSVVLSLLVYSNADSSISVNKVFSKVKSCLKCDIKLLQKNELSLKKFDYALGKLKHLKPLVKPQLLKACAYSINANNKITPRQIELYRAISDILDCPMPPLTNF